MSDNKIPSPIMVFSWSMAFINVLFLVFLIFANEMGHPLATLLRNNFRIYLLLIFGTIIIFLFIVVLKLLGFDVTKVGKNKEWDSSWKS